jgi:hypothetical protein
MLELLIVLLLGASSSPDLALFPRVESPLLGSTSLAASRVLPHHNSCELQYNNIYDPFYVNEHYKCVAIDCAECRMESSLTGLHSPKWVVTCLCNGGVPTGSPCVSYVYFDFNSITGMTVISVSCVAYNCSPGCTDNYPQGPQSGDPVCRCQ